MCNETLKLVRDSALQLQIPAARANGDASLSSGNIPALRYDVPEREVVAGEREGDGLGLAGVQPDGIEALQVVGCLVCRGRRRRV